MIPKAAKMIKLQESNSLVLSSRGKSGQDRKKNFLLFSFASKIQGRMRLVKINNNNC